MCVCYLQCGGGKVGVNVLEVSIKSNAPAVHVAAEGWGEVEHLL